MLIYKTMLSRLTYLIALIALCVSSPSLAATAQDAITKKIESNLFFPRNFKESDKAALINFDIQTSGHISNLVINDNGVSKSVTNQCVFAIHKSEPFENITETKHISFSCQNSKPQKRYAVILTMI